MESLADGEVTISDQKIIRSIAAEVYAGIRSVPPIVLDFRRGDDPDLVRELKLGQDVAIAINMRELHGVDLYTKDFLSIELEQEQFDEPSDEEDIEEGDEVEGDWQGYEADYKKDDNRTPLLGKVVGFIYDSDGVTRLAPVVEINGIGRITFRNQYHLEPCIVKFDDLGNKIFSIPTIEQRKREEIVRRRGLNHTQLARLGLDEIQSTLETNINLYDSVLHLLVNGLRNSIGNSIKNATVLMQSRLNMGEGDSLPAFLRVRALTLESLTRKAVPGQVFAYLEGRKARIYEVLETEKGYAVIDDKDLIAVRSIDYKMGNYGFELSFGEMVYVQANLFKGVFFHNKDTFLSEINSLETRSYNRDLKLGIAFILALRLLLLKDQYSDEEN